MLIWTARLSKKKLAVAVILAGALLAALICLFSQRAPEESSSVPQLSGNPERIAYLQSFGWEIEPEPVETLQFLFPETLEEPYLSYNQLQLAQGFDLSTCCGKQVSRYTYAVTNYPDCPDGVQVNLYVCEDRPVAGDIFCAGTNGFQEPLAFPGKQ